MNVSQLKPLKMARVIAICQALNLESPEAIILEIESCYSTKKIEGEPDRAVVSNVVKYFALAKSILVEGQQMSSEEADEVLENFPIVNEIVIWFCNQISTIINPVSTSPN